MQRSLRFVIPLTLVFLAACPKDDIEVGKVGLDGGVDSATTGGGSTACDPFAPVAKPIALGTILGAGRNAAGTIYVVDQINSTSRVFVSDATGTLVRQHGGVVGTVTETTSTAYTCTVDGPSAPFVVQIDVPASGPTRMAVMQGTLTDRKSIVIGQDGEELTVLANAAIAGMPLHNLPGTITVEYVATMPDGASIVVTHPTDDWTFNDFRLFLGQSAAVVERTVNSVTRYRDGGTTIIVFDLDGASTSAKFPVILSPSGTTLGPATLTVSGSALPLTRQSAPPAGATYLCR